MKRRDFVKQACILCAGTSAFSMLISACGAPLNIYKSTVSSHLISVPLTAFGVNNYVIVRTGKIDYDILISRSPEAAYKGILMKCTHRDAPLRYNSGGLICNEHGSRFDFDGRVLKEPATKNLSEVILNIENENLLINLNTI